MALPNNTATVLQFMFPTASPITDWEVRHFDGVITIPKWSSGSQKPTEAEIVAAAASPEFAAWLDKRTDPIKRRREEAKKILATSNEPIVIAVRAALKAVGASLREVRQAQGKSVRSDNQFMGGVMGDIDTGAGEV